MAALEYTIASAIPAQKARARDGWLVLSGLLLAIFAFNFFTLQRAPAPFWDEVWYASRAWALIQTGTGFSPLDGGVIEQYEGYENYFPYLAPALQAVGIGIFGLNLFTVRLVSLVFGMLLLAATYFLARRAHGERPALLAVVLLALAPAFAYSSHLGRPDIIVAALGYSAIALCWTEDRPGFPLKSLLAGLALGFGLDVHLNIVIFAAPILALFLFDHGRSVLRRPRLWGFAAGAGAGVLFYLAVHVLPDPQAYFTVFEFDRGPERTPALLTPDPGIWLKAIADTISRLDLLALPLAVATAFLAWRRLPNDKRLLVLLGAIVLTFLVVIRPKQPFYAILIVPLVCLAVAPMLDWLLFHKWRDSLRWRVAGALVVAVLIATAARGLTPLLHNSEVEFELVLDKVRGTIPAGSSVMGPATYWLAMPGGQDYILWEQIFYYQSQVPGATAEDALRHFHSDYLILDGFDKWNDRFRAFLDRHASLVAEQPTQSLGPVRIYALTWSQ